VIALAADCSRERAEPVFSAPHAVEYVLKIEVRLPAEFSPGASIDVDTIDAREHSPGSRSIDFLIVREQGANHSGSFGAS
jgi:hypothetical protein